MSAEVFIRRVILLQILNIGLQDLVDARKLLVWHNTMDLVNASLESIQVPSSLHLALDSSLDFNCAIGRKYLV